MVKVVLARLLRLKLYLQDSYGWQDGTGRGYTVLPGNMTNHECTPDQTDHPRDRFHSILAAFPQTFIKTMRMPLLGEDSRVQH